MRLAKAGLLLAALLASTTSVAADTKPQRIVTLAPNLAELVCDAGACERLVAVSRFSDFPAAVAKLPTIGDGFAVSNEGVLASHPDLVLAWAGGTPQAAIDRLRGLGLRVEVVDVGRLDSIAAALETLGRLLGTEPLADEAAAAYRARLAELRARWHGAAPIRAVYQIGAGPSYVIGGTSPIDEALTTCGGINVFGDLKQPAAPVGAESMLAAKPEAVIFGGEDGLATMQAYWARLPASEVQRLGTLYPVNADWLSRPTPRMLDGIQQLCTSLDDARARRAKAHAP